MNWCRRHDLNAPKYMRLTLDMSDAIDIEQIDADQQVFCARLMTDLALKTKDAAKRIVMNIEQPDNGLEAWRQLGLRGQGGGPQRRAGLLNQILRFDFRGASFMDRVCIWETLVRQYERPGSSKIIDDDIKIATVTGGATGDLKKQLIARAMTFVTWEQMRSYLEEFHDNNRAYVMPGYLAEKTSHGGRRYVRQGWRQRQGQGQRQRRRQGL